MKSKKKFDNEFALYIILLTIFLILLRYSYSLDQKAGHLRAQQVPPSFWPKIIIFGLIFLTAILLIKKIKMIISNQNIETNIKIEQEPFIRLILLISICFLYAFGMEYIGFMLATPILGILILFLLGIRTKIYLLSFPIVLTFALYVIFTRILYILLPRGIGIFHQFSRLFY